MTITFPPDLEPVVIEWAKTLLAARGYSVIKLDDDGPWMRPKELRLHLVPGMNAETFLARLHSPDAPPLAVQRAPGGRLLKVQLSDSLSAWLTRPLLSGERFDLVQ